MQKATRGYNSEGHPEVLVVGFSDDVAAVVDELSRCSRRVLAVPENADAMDLPAMVGCVVYVFSQDTLVSSQLYSLFTYIQCHLAVGSAFMVRREGMVDRLDLLPSFSRPPDVPIRDLVALLTG